MESRQASIIINDLENKFRTIQNQRIFDDSTLNQLECFITQLGQQIDRLQNSGDPIFVPKVLPTILEISINLVKICSEKSDFFQFGSNLTREKVQPLMNLTKNCYNQMKEYLKSAKLGAILNRSNEQRSFCHELRNVSDSIGQSDLLTTLICQKLIVKILTGSSDDQSTQSNFSRMEDLNDGLAIETYRSVLRQLATISSRKSRDTTTIRVR